MKKYSALTLFSFFIITTANAQFYNRSRSERYRTVQSQRNNQLPRFQPSVNILFGYGFPNLDKYELLEFSNFYHNKVNQTGPVFGEIDYQFNRAMSLGAIVSYGKLTSPYYSDNTSYLAFTGSLQSWSFMVNFMRYIPATKKISPYFKTAIGINIWTQSYLDPSGNKVVVASDPNEFAYQASFGVKFNLMKQSGLFLEAGYGKYILSGGLSFKF